MTTEPCQGCVWSSFSTVFTFTHYHAADLCLPVCVCVCASKRMNERKAATVGVFARMCERKISLVTLIWKAFLNGGVVDYRAIYVRSNAVWTS